MALKGQGFSPAEKSQLDARAVADFAGNDTIHTKSA